MREADITPAGLLDRRPVAVVRDSVGDRLQYRIIETYINGRHFHKASSACAQKADTRVDRRCIERKRRRAKSLT